MRRTKTATRETLAARRLDYIMAAAWYWVRAEGADENLVCALNRMKATNLKSGFDALRLPVPPDEEIYAYARERWPQYKLHPLEQA